MSLAVADALDMFNMKCVNGDEVLVFLTGAAVGVDEEEEEA